MNRSGLFAAIRVEEQSVGRLLAGIALAGALALASVVSGPFGAAAQPTADAPAQGITVSGFGVASVPAETADLQIIVSQTNYGPPSGLQPGATPGAEERMQSESVVTSLTDAGVAEGDIDVIVSPVLSSYYGPSGPGVARIDVSIESPTAERIAEIVDAATVGAANERLVIGQVGVSYGVTDCAPLRRRAAEAALVDVRTRAELQADIVGVELGEITGVTDVPVDPSGSWSPYYGGFFPLSIACGPAVPVLPTGASVTLAPYDPTAEAAVSVYAQIVVTYEIARGTAATPLT